MDDARPCEVGEACRCKRTATPAPGSLDRVDEARHDHGKGEESPKLHPFRNGAGNNGHGRGDENHLEEIIGASGVVGFTAGCQHFGGRIFRANAHAEAGNPRAFGDVSVHQSVAKEQVHDAGDGKKRHVFGEDFRRILGAHEARLKHGEARGHEHDQSTHYEKVKGVD